MYQIGDYVVKANNGVCRIEDILHLDLSSVDRNKLYYLLIPREQTKTKVYVPVEAADSMIRKVISEEEAWQIIRRIPEIEAAWITDERRREQKYKEALKSCDPQALVSIIKNMYERKKKRDALGKKNTVTDERYFRLAEDSLYSELAFALGRDKEEMQKLIADTIDHETVPA
jgi:CarD family transcriptional regulator